MTAQNEFDRALDTWFSGEAAAAPPPEPLARVIESTLNSRPRPALLARIGSGWVSAGSTSGVRGGIARLRPAVVFVLVALLALALAGGALLVGSRLIDPRPILHSYLDELISAPDLPTPVGRPVLVPLLDGRVLIVGSDYGNGRDTATTAYLYDPATGAAAPAGPIVSANGFVHSAVRLRDGRVLIIGDGIAQLFDPKVMRFTEVGPMVAARSGASTALLRDGRVLIAGGFPPRVTTGSDPALQSAELFDPDTLTFSPTGRLGTFTGGGPMVALPDGRVFVATDPTAEVYDPATGTFGAASTMSGGGGYPVVLPDGRVVIFRSTGLYFGGSITVWDPVARTFSVTSLAEPLTGAALLDDGRILVIGMCYGRQTGWTGLYDPATGITNPGPSTPACQPTSTRLADGRVLIVGGDVGPNPRAVPMVQIFRRSGAETILVSVSSARAVGCRWTRTTRAAVAIAVAHLPHLPSPGTGRSRLRRPEGSSPGRPAACRDPRFPRGCARSPPAVPSRVAGGRGPSHRIRRFGRATRVVPPPADRDPTVEGPPRAEADRDRRRGIRDSRSGGEGPAAGSPSARRTGQPWEQSRPCGQSRKRSCPRPYRLNSVQGQGVAGRVTFRPPGGVERPISRLRPRSTLAPGIGTSHVRRSECTTSRPMLPIGWRTTARASA